MGETLIKGGTVVDGTGAPRKEADVLISDGKIKAVEKGLSTTGEIVDASGLTVTPGTIDVHTHMDGQFFFEPHGISSSWHGVTTVLMGHCGYSLAPVRPEHRDYIIHMFARVEEVAPVIFEKYLPWDWVTFGEYLDSMDKGLGLNAMAQVGHSTLRYYVMGEDSKREATEQEIERMGRILHECIEAGAFGFTTSRAPAHNAWDGSPVPSRYATPEEVIKLGAEFKFSKVGTLGMNPLGLFTGMTEEDKRIIWEITARSGKSIQLNGVKDDAWPMMREAAEEGRTVYGITAAQPFYRFWDLHVGTNAFNTMDTWMQIMNKPVEERLKAFADPSIRPKLREEVDGEATIDGTKMRRPRLVWNELRVDKAAKEKNRRYDGMSIQEIADQEGKHLADAVLDLVVSEGLKTRFIHRFAPESTWFTESRREVYSHPNAFPMNSDAGAHLANECKTGEGTYFLRHWVLDEGAMSLEEGVRKLTSQAAEWVGLPDRGVLAPGKVADIAVYDLDKIGALTKEEAHDLPGGATRWVQRSTGVHHVWVNGVPTMLHGKDTGELPGKVLRSGSYR